MRVIRCDECGAAIAYCGRADSLGATIYITGEPCDMCSKLIKAAGIERVVYPEPS